MLRLLRYCWPWHNLCVQTVNLNWKVREKRREKAEVIVKRGKDRGEWRWMEWMCKVECEGLSADRKRGNEKENDIEEKVKKERVGVGGSKDREHRLDLD